MSKMKIIVGVLVALLIVTGVLVVRTVKFLTAPPPAAVTEEEKPDVTIADADEAIKADVTMKAGNTVALTVTGMGGKIAAVEYELTYDVGGLVKGVNSGSKPIDVAGKDELTRDVYLGTCSKNVCTPDKGVTSVTLALKFTDTESKLSQLKKTFEL